MERDAAVDKAEELLLGPDVVRHRETVDPHLR
jgi:hypothetical protein